MYSDISVAKFVRSESRECTCKFPYGLECELSGWTVQTYEHMKPDVCLRTPHLAILQKPWINDNGKSYSRAGVFIHVQRRPNWFITNVTDMLAFVIFCCVGIAALPVGDAGSRAALLITILLAVLVYMDTISSSLPQKHYTTCLHKYMRIALIFIVMLVLETTVLGILVRLDPEGSTEEDWRLPDVIFCATSIGLLVTFMLIWPRWKPSLRRKWQRVYWMKGYESVWVNAVADLPSETKSETKVFL